MEIFKIERKLLNIINVKAFQISKSQKTTPTAKSVHAVWTAQHTIQQQIGSIISMGNGETWEGSYSYGKKAFRAAGRKAAF